MEERRVVVGGAGQTAYVVGLDIEEASDSADLTRLMGKLDDCRPPDGRESSFRQLVPDAIV